MNEYQILNVIKENGNLSQGSISKKVNLATSMVNNYMKKLEVQGYITKRGTTNKNMSYELTEEGENRRLFHLISYTSEIVNLYKVTKQEFEQRIQRIIDKDIKTIIFYGAGETGEVLMHAIRNLNIQLLGFVDDDNFKVTKDFFGYKVYSHEDIELIKPDAILITSFTFADIIYEKCEHFITKGIRVYKI